jgi:hypothetical protein
MMVISLLPSLRVIPAEAGISGGFRARYSPETPASAGVTDVERGAA